MAISALLAAALLAAEPVYADRILTVSGWTIADRAEQDGGRLVTLSKSGRGWTIEHRFALWHGNGGIYVGATFHWNGCDSGESDGLFPWDETVTTEILGLRTRDYMEECSLSEAEQRAVLAGLARANQTAQRWITDYRRRLDAESE
jgi:hypothetical protein